MDSYAKLLEVDREYIYKTDIPLLKAEIQARLANLTQSRHRAEKYGEVDIFTKEDYYGMNALSSALNSLFGGKDNKQIQQKAKNLRSR